MDIWKNFVDHLRLQTLRWLGKGSGSSWLLAGTLACAGFGAAGLSGAPGTVSPQDRGTVGTLNLPVSYPGCYADPDGDGHIFCAGSVTISNLPKSFGFCFADPDGDHGIICAGTAR
jgi:hypothetical protein